MAGNAVARMEPKETAVTLTPMDMLQIAVEKGADLDQLQKLMDLQERWEKNEAKKAYDAAMNAFKADPPDISKNKHVEFGRTIYDHATLDHVCEAINFALSKHGLSHRWAVDQGADDSGSWVKVDCIITHTLGHSETVFMKSPPDTSGSKNSIQAIASTVTYLQRYTLLAATGLAAKDSDDDGKASGGGLVSDEQRESLEALAKEAEADVGKFLKYMGVEAFAQIPQAAYVNATKALENKLEKKRSAA